MNKDDRRYRAAYHLLHAHIASQIALGHLTGGAKAEAEALLASVEAELDPPEFEEVEVVRWGCLRCGKLYTHEASLCTCHPTGSPVAPYAPVKLTGTVKRPVRRAVIREYEVAAKVDSCGDVRGIGGRPFADQPECHGKAGVLIFRTAE